MSGAEALIGLIIAVPGVIDVAIKYGKWLQKKADLFMGAQSDSRLQGFIIELTTGEINDILGFIKNVVEKLPLAFLNEVNHATTILSSILQKACEAFPDDSFADKKGVLSKVKYSMYDAKKIRDAVEELEVWKFRFTQRVTIFKTFCFERDTKIRENGVESTKMKTEVEHGSISHIQARLDEILKAKRAKSGPLIVGAVDITKYRRLDHSSLWYSESEQSVVELHSYEGKIQKDVEDMRAAVRKIAKSLREVDSKTMNILECEGFSDNTLTRCFALHFSVLAAQGNPRSLRSLLAGEENKKGRKHSLTDRIRLAQSIASAVLYVHASGFVHKNIRPENIIIFDSTEKDALRFPYAIGHPYLVGYDGVREEHEASLYADVTDWQRKIYLPKERLAGGQTKVKFTWKHDIYALGVVLLEIALWKDFTNDNDQLGKTLKNAPDALTALQKELKQVPRLLGDKYHDATLSCLEMLQNEPGELIRDEDGVLLGINYVAQVLDKLEAIVL